jgi:hypothetical protein
MIMERGRSRAELWTEFLNYIRATMAAPAAGGRHRVEADSGGRGIAARTMNRCGANPT